MRAWKIAGCAIALTAFLAPGAHANEWNKLTYVTFSAPVELPGITLPAGTYTFKLADTWSNRHILQVFDKQQHKIYGTFLTISDRKLQPSGKPTVLFNEAPSGTPTAVRAFFYPGDVFGDEFVYPKREAMRIAKNSHQSVMAMNESDVAAGHDVSKMKGAKVGHVDANGNMTEDSEDNRANAGQAAAGTAGSAASKTSGTTGRYTAAPRELNHRTGPAENGDVMNRYNENGPSPGDNVNRTMARGGQTVTSGGSRAGAASNDQQSARTSAHHATSAAAGTSSAAAGTNAATGTSGQSNDADNHAGATHRRKHLPQTASPLALFALLSGLSLAGAGGVRQLRKRYADGY